MYSVDSMTDSRDVDNELLEKIEILRRQKVVIVSDFISAAFSVNYALTNELVRQDIVRKVEVLIRVEADTLSVMVRLSEAYQEKGEIVLMQKLGQEMEEVETEFKRL